MSKIYVVGIGPGNKETMTQHAIEVLEKCSCIVGYTTYIELVRKHFPNKEYIETGMTKEVDRCKQALEKAKSGIETAIIGSGDASVYGLAGLVLEMIDQYPLVEVEVVAGVTAALSGSAVLGAAVGHDFATISLSDLLTPWDIIEKRIKGAALGDFVICLYNPSSKKRADRLKRACEIILRYKSKDTVCGIVRNIGREGEESRILSLEELMDTEVDMFTTVFIGNSETYEKAGRMITPRGYQTKYDEIEANTSKDTAISYWEDEAFLRNVEKHVPMTKFGVRVLSVEQLELKSDSCIYDIGAGTGSVTIEMAKRSQVGEVYAIEKNPDAINILRDNVKQFGLNNIQIIEGTAPEALHNLPVPTHVFIGGSSGKLSKIIETIRDKNPDCRIVVNAVTMETIAEIMNIIKRYDYKDSKVMQVSITDVKQHGSYNMMKANNPVFIVKL